MTGTTHLGASDRRLVDATALPVYDLGTGHPFARDRQRPLFDLLRTCGLIGEGDLLPVRPATDDELATVHDRAYIELLKATSEPEPPASVLRRAPMFGLGTPDNPIGRDQHASAAAVAGATIACVDAVLAGTCRSAFNPAGGLHHAMPHGAAGFCLYNDVAIAIRRARAAGCARVLYVDLDVHHGDGVEWTFRADPTVLTLSFHETPDVRFPFTGREGDLGEGDGRGYAWNVPLQPGTGDESWLECVQRVLEIAVRSFRPDLIVSQHGCDPHREDPLATLDCTTRIFRSSTELLRELADAHCGGRWVATGGGGYQPYRVIPRAWTLVWSTLSGRPLPGSIPAAWRERWEKVAGEPLPATWLDDPGPETATARAAGAANRAAVDRLLASVDWL